MTWENKNPYPIFIFGHTGKMGLEIKRYIETNTEFLYVGGTSSSQSADFPSGALGIDFSTPQALEENVRLCAEKKSPLLVGTTGLTQKHLDLLATYASQIPILYTANTSLGILMLKKLTTLVSQWLGSEYDIEITETHHRHKKDAPSGTALSLGEAAAQGLGLPSLPQPVVLERSACRPKGFIGFSVLRGGSIIGDHTVNFFGENEVISLSHRALSRRLFAQGAIESAKWLAGKPPRLYTMDDILLEHFR